MVTTSASSRCSLSPIAGGYGSVTTAALRPRSRKQPCPSQVTSNRFPSLHPLGGADPDQVQRLPQSVTRRPAQLQPRPCQGPIVDHHAIFARPVARVIETVDGRRQVMYVIRNAMRLEQARRVFHHLWPEGQLPRDVELPRVDQ